MEAKSKFICLKIILFCEVCGLKHRMMNWNSVYKAKIINRIVMISAMCKKLTTFCAWKYPCDLKTCEFFVKMCGEV
jgi:hypothetical protein